MNWYKLAQRYYEDVRREDYEEGKEGDDYFESDQYFSIGQSDDEIEPGEEEPEPATCWIYEGGHVDTAVGGTHNMNWPHLMKNTFIEGSNEYFRGWFDPNQNMVSVVARRRAGDQRKFDMTAVPSRLLSQLASEFGEDIDIKVF
jgi:hypothetical protein